MLAFLYFCLYESLNLGIRNATSLTSIDLSSNQILKNIHIENSELLDLNTSNNSELAYVTLLETHMPTLDFSNNPNLLYLKIDGNPSLTAVNLKNANNSIIDYEYHTVYYDSTSEPSVGFSFTSQVSIQNCANLNSICVDDVEYATTNFIDVQSNATFSENCEEAYNQLTGNTTYDLNNNGCDENDIPVNGFLVNVNDGTYNFASFSSIIGEYNLNLLTGDFTVELLNVPEYYTVNPATTSLSFSGAGEQAQQDFCLTANQAIEDLNITLLPINQARPGFEADYQLVVNNMGTQTVNDAAVNLTFDESKQSFVSASESSSAETDNSLTFEVNDLVPFGTQTIDFTMQTFEPPTVSGEDILAFTATVSPNESDYTPEDNMFEFDQEVVNSFDPNDKQVVQGDEIEIEEADQYLDYIIRFQNTGTASAINVRILDTLHPKLDWNTLQPVSASDDYRVEITDGNHVEFIFDDINLPYEDENEPGSHGFMAYKIKPKDNVAIGDVITGDAGIYFDFNAPIITNTVSTEIVETLGVEKYILGNQVKIYPNPTKGFLNIQTTKNVQLESVTVYNLQGRELLNFQQNLKTLNLEPLSPGMYILKIKTNQGTMNQQLIKQ